MSIKKNVKISEVIRLNIKPCIFIIMLSFQSLYAQKHEFGTDIGYGTFYADTHNVSFKELYGNDLKLGSYYEIGFIYHFTPIHAPFKLQSGVNYAYRKEDNMALNNLRIPLLLNFYLGKKIQFIFGAGLYFNYLFSYNVTNPYSDLPDTKHLFQLGVLANTGIGYQISSKYRVFINYQINNDITNIYIERYGYKTGPRNNEGIRGYDNFISIGVLYKLEPKLKNENNKHNQ